MTNQSSIPKEIQKDGPTQKEIDEHLHELNLATLSQERQKRQEWFRAHKIPLMQIETIFYLVPEDVENVQEMLLHLHRANIFLMLLSEQLDWLKNNHIIVKLEKTDQVKRYVFVEQKPVYPNAPQTSPGCLIQKDDRTIVKEDRGTP